MKRFYVGFQIFVMVAPMMASPAALGSSPLVRQAKTAPQARALMPAATSAPIGQIPFAGTSMAPYGSYGYPYNQPYQPQISAGAYAYSPAAYSPMAYNGMNGYAQMGYGQQMSPYGQYPGMPPQIGMYGQQMGMYPQAGMYGQQMGMYPQAGMMGGIAGMQPTTPMINPAMLMGAIGAISQMFGKSPSSGGNRPAQENVISTREPYTPSSGDNSRYARKGDGGAPGRGEEQVQQPEQAPADRPARGRGRPDITPQPIADAAPENKPAARAAAEPATRRAPKPDAQPEQTATQPAPVPAPQPAPQPAPREELPAPAEVSKNEAKSLMEGAQKISSMQKQMSNPAAAPVPDLTCKDCAQKSLRDETCDAKNSYFETLLSSADNNAIKLAQNQTANAQTVKCISQAMRAANDDRIQFVNCAKSGAAFGEIVARPCASDNMVKTMAGAYELVSECLAGYVDPRADQANGQSIRSSLKKSLFQVWNYESGWAANAVKKTPHSINGGGLGQLVPPVITAINEKSGTNPSKFEEMKNYISQSKNKACQALAKYDFKGLRPAKENACDRVAMDNGNPMQNMMYSMAFLKIVRSSLYKSLTSVEGVSPVLRERLIDQLTVWGQGAGGQAISTAIEKTMKAHGTLLVGQASEQKYSEFMSFMKAEVRDSLEAIKKASPRAPVNPDLDSQYLENTQKALASLEQSINGQCGQF